MGHVPLNSYWAKMDVSQLFFKWTCPIFRKFGGRMKSVSKVFNLLFLALILYFAFFWYNQIMREKTLRKIIENLRAETRIAEVLVTDSHEDPTSAAMTTIKFLEYDASGRPLPPRYFTFNVNVIQF